MPPRRLFHTSLLLGTLLRNSRSVSSWLPPSTLDVLCPTCARPVPSLLLDAAVQTPLHSVATHDASTQQPLTEFFIGCIFSNDPSDRQGLSLAQCSADGASPPQPADIATLCSPSSASHASDGHEHTTAPHVLLVQPPGLEKYARQFASHGILVKAAPVRPRLCTSISVTPSQPHVSTTQVGTHPVRSATTCKRSASTAPAGTHNPVGAVPRAGTGPFPKPRALVLPVVKFGQSKPDGLGHIDTADSDLMHHQYRLSVFQWNPGPARRNPTNIIATACGRFHAVVLQEASDHVPAHLRSVSSLHTLTTRTSPSCSTRTPSSPTLWCLPSLRAPQAKVRGVWSYSSFEACCDALHRRLHFALYTSTMSWPRNVTLPHSYFSGFTGTEAAQRRLHWERLQHECFIPSW